jgi:hypothetical protein
VISTWSSFAAVGIPCSADCRPLTFLAISCFAAWRTGSRPIVLGTWIGRVSVCSIGPGRLRRPDSVPWICADSLPLRPGTILGREWNGQMQQVAVLADGFAWNGNTYPSLSKVAFAITGTRWNGPKSFGLRDKLLKGPP